MLVICAFLCLPLAHRGRTSSPSCSAPASSCTRASSWPRSATCALSSRGSVSLAWTRWGPTLSGTSQVPAQTLLFEKVLNGIEQTENLMQAIRIWPFIHWDSWGISILLILSSMRAAASAALLCFTKGICETGSWTDQNLPSEVQCRSFVDPCPYFTRNQKSFWDHYAQGSLWPPHLLTSPSLSVHSFSL